MNGGQNFLSFEANSGCGAGHSSMTPCNSTGGGNAPPPLRPTSGSGCLPVAYVPGGTPQYNSKGCITEYISNLIILLI